MRKFFALLAVALMCTANVNAQMIELEVVQLDLDSTVTVPAGEATIVVFVPGSGADPFGPTPPNGDLIFIGGNATGSPGLLASAACGLPTPTDPTLLGDFPTANFMIVGADASGAALLSNHTDTTLAEDGTGLACFTADPDMDPATADGQTTDNAFAQTFTVGAATDIDSVLIAIDLAIEGNNPLGVDTDGDGVGDAPSILDGFIPLKVFFFFGIVPTFDGLGSIETPDAEFCVNLDVGVKGCTNPIGDINLDGTVDLLDVTPFVELLTNAGFQCEADIDENGTVDLLDVTPFVELLTGG